MIEIYNCTRQGFAYGNLIFAVMGAMAVIGLLVWLVFLMKSYFTNRRLFKGISGYVKLLIAIIGIPMFSVMALYNVSIICSPYEYQTVLEENGYIVESGKIEDLQIYEITETGHVGEEADGDDDSYDFPDGCEIVFYLNGKFFDSYFAYGANIFSYDDIKLLRKSDSVEIKYIVENGERVILSMAVSGDNK